MLPTLHQDVWTKATAAEIDQTLTSMRSLSARHTDVPALSNAAYHVGLSGVTRYGLAECVKGVFQNKLGHRYFPDPQEMRRLCDQAMQPHEQQREREHRQRRLEQEAAQHKPKASVTPEARARSLKLYQDYCASYEAAKKKIDDAAERARIRSDYGLTEEALARVPDAPNSFGQMGSR